MKQIYLILTGAEDKKFRRAKKLLKLLKNKKDISNSIIIISGLSSLNPKQKNSEASQYKNYLKKNYPGELPKIILEEEAQDTLGNMIYSKSIIEEESKKKNITLYLITERYHMKRSLFLFQKIFEKNKNIFLIPITVNTYNFQLILIPFIFIFYIITIPLSLIGLLTLKNKYFKDMITNKIIKKDISTLQLNTPQKIETYTKKLSIYSQEEKQYEKGIYNKCIELLKK